MKKVLCMVGIFAVTVMMSVAPAFAVEAETGHFAALEGITSSAPMSDTELAAVEGQAPPGAIAGQIGLVNVSAQTRVGNVSVIRNVTVRDVNVAVLSAGRQQ
jgi:hypothetical protein